MRQKIMQTAGLGVYLYLGAKTTSRLLDDGGAGSIITLASVLHFVILADEFKTSRSIKECMRDLLPHFMVSIMMTMFLIPALTNVQKESDTMFDFDVLCSYFVITLALMGASRLIVNRKDIFETDHSAADKKKGLEENLQTSAPIFKSPR